MSGEKNRRGEQTDGRREGGKKRNLKFAGGGKRNPSQKGENSEKKKGSDRVGDGKGKTNAGEGQ